MSQVRIANIAHHFHAMHTVASVFVVADDIPGDRLGETGPSRSGFKLRLRVEQQRTATHARIASGLMCLAVLAGERSLGAFSPCDVIYIRRKQAAPFFFGRSEEHTSELQSREKLVCR